MLPLPSFFCVSGKMDPCSKTEEKTPKCTSTCESGYSVTYNQDKHHGATAHSFRSVEAIATEIMNNGPVEGTMRVYSDFLQYKTGSLTLYYNNWMGNL